MSGLILRAPSGDGELLEVPPLAEAERPWRENRARFETWDHDFQGRGALRLRAMARRDAFAVARSCAIDYGFTIPDHNFTDSSGIVMTGHQPELFHPGVWVKNFAVAALARRLGGVGLNMIVDNDLPKTSEIRVPRRTAEGLAVERIPFDSWSLDVPFEDWRVQNESIFADFGGKIEAAVRGLVNEPIAVEFWPIAAAARSDRSGVRFAAARSVVETAWGAGNFEILLGRTAETESFAWFLCHILAHLPRYRQVHNDALASYRSAHRIRSKNHPVADLGAEGDWLEAPFWAWRESAPRRRPLLIRARSKSIDLRIGGEPERFVELPLGADRDACCAVDRLLETPRQGIRIRPRALTTTMFARLLVGDLFVHGIGGAKYDELGDEIIRGFLGIEPPAFLALSLTLWIGFDEPISGSSIGGLEALNRRLRDFRFNPDRVLGDDAPASARVLIGEKRDAIRSPCSTRFERKRRTATIRRLNEALEAYLAAERDRLLGERDRLLIELKRRAPARYREYSLVAHDRSRFLGALARHGISPESH